MKAQSVSQSKIVAGVLASVVMIGSLLGFAALSAQTGPSSSCSGDTIYDFGETFFGLEDLGNRLLSTSPTSRDFPLPSPLPAGDYAVNGVSYDGYLERETISPQPQEQWIAEFVAADGTVLATTGATGDLEDEVEEAQWSGSLGDVSIAADAVLIRTVHAAPGSSSVNSVRPVCLGLTGGPVIPEVVPEPEPDPEPAPLSSVTVDYDSDATQVSSAAIGCGDLSESATGDTIDISITDLAPGSVCTATFSDEFDCSVLVDPIETAGAFLPGAQVVTVPTTGGAVNVTVDINCGDRSTGLVVSPPTTEAAPVEITPPTTAAPSVSPPTTAAIQAEVQTQTETNVSNTPVAPAAQPQIGTPAFTG